MTSVHDCLYYVRTREHFEFIDTARKLGLLSGHVTYRYTGVADDGAASSHD